LITLGWNWRIRVRAASSHQQGGELGTSCKLAPAGEKEKVFFNHFGVELAVSKLICTFAKKSWYDKTYSIGY